MPAGTRPPRTDLPRFASRLRPLVDGVAAVPASVHTKLLAGFLCVAALLLVVATASLLVQRHMADRVSELDQAQQQLDHLRQMQYLVTAQSHYRTMALLTHDGSYNDQIDQAKADFLGHLDALDQIAPPEQRGPLARIREVNDRFTASSQRVLAVYQARRDAEALSLHLGEEHPLSHEIENPLALMLNQAAQQMQSSQAVYASDQQLLTGLELGFSVLSLIAAAVLGFVFSWSFLLPLGRVEQALAAIAGGNFGQHLELPNRDEFGALAHDLNVTSKQLETIYSQLHSLNAQLRGTNTELLAQLQAQVEELARSRGLVTEAEERVRRELAEVLHSRVQTRLLVLWYRLEDLLKGDLLRTDPAAATVALGELREQIDNIREHEVRRLSHRLHPSIIRTGLVPALEVLAEETVPLDVQLDVDAQFAALDGLSGAGVPEPVRLTAYRVVEEALANVVKHAYASRVELTLRLISDGLEISVCDDGRGLPEAPIRPGLGLGSIAAHVGRVAGRWSITGRPGHGTCLTAVLPCSVEQLQQRLSAQAALWHERGAEANSGASVVRTV
jgi:signal transduction histidine kinase